MKLRLEINIDEPAFDENFGECIAWVLSQYSNHAKKVLTRPELERDIGHSPSRVLATARLIQ